MPVELRPLGVGEIFDRAVTLYVRNFSVFTIVAAFIVVPLMIARYFYVSAEAGSWAQVFQQIQHPAAKHAPALTFSPWLYAVIVLSLLLTPFMYVAIASVIGRIYKGESSDWQGAWRVALRNAGGIIVTIIAQLFLLIAAVFAGALVFGFLIGLSAVFMRYVMPVGIVLAILSAVYLLVFVAALMVLYLGLALAFDAIGIEQLSCFKAVSAGLARVFNRRELGKALLVCLALIAVQIGLMIASFGIASLLDAALHQRILETIAQGVLSLISTSFLGVLIAVYYFDVRIRSEGLDLQAELDRLQAQPQA